MAIILFFFMTDANIFSENALLYYFRRQFFLFQFDTLSHIGNADQLLLCIGLFLSPILKS